MGSTPSIGTINNPKEKCDRFQFLPADPSVGEDCEAARIPWPPDLLAARPLFGHTLLTYLMRRQDKLEELFDPVLTNAWRGRWRAQAAATKNRPALSQLKSTICNASVAQLDRASDFGSEGYRFKSCRTRHFDNQGLTTTAPESYNAELQYVQRCPVSSTGIPARPKITVVEDARVA